MHVMIVLSDVGHMAAVVFQPKSGGRVWESTALTVCAPHDKQYMLGPMVIDALNEWPDKTAGSGWYAFEGVWAPSILYSMYSTLGHEPPWHKDACMDISTAYWLLGNPSSTVDSGPARTPADECVKRICQLQDALGRLRR